MTKFEHYVTFVMTFLWFLIKIRQTWNSKLRKNSDWSKKNSLTNKKFVSPVFSNFVIFQNWLMKCQRPWLQKAPSKFEIIYDLELTYILYVGWFKLSRHGKLIGLVFPAFQTPAVHFPQVLPEKSAFTWLTFLFSKNTLNCCVCVYGFTKKTTL